LYLPGGVRRDTHSEDRERRGRALDEVGARRDPPEEAEVLVLEDALEPRVGRRPGLALGHAGLVRARQEPQAERVLHRVQGELARADARDHQAVALLEAALVGRVQHQLDHGEGRDRAAGVGGDHVVAAPLLVLVHELLQAHAVGLARRDRAHAGVEPLAPGLAVLDEGVHEHRLADALHRDVVARPLAVLEELLGALVLDRLGVLGGLLPARARPSGQAKKKPAKGQAVCYQGA